MESSDSTRPQPFCVYPVSERECGAVLLQWLALSSLWIALSCSTGLCARRNARAIPAASLSERTTILFFKVKGGSKRNWRIFGERRSPQHVPCGDGRIQSPSASKPSAFVHIRKYSAAAHCSSSVRAESSRCRIVSWLFGRVPFARSISGSIPLRRTARLRCGPSPAAAGLFPGFLGECPSRASG